MDNVSSKTQELMEKALQALKRDLNTVSTGRATPNLLDTVRVDSYGNFVPLNQISNISVTDSTTITIQPWDKTVVNAIAKSIMEANLGLNPQVDGMVLRINIPKLSEERRKELVKLIKKYGEDKKISVRNLRRDALDEIKKQKNAFSEDEVKRFGDKIQKLTDDYTGKIDTLVGDKEKEIMQV
jgi:ribosome recycling factor